MMPHGAARDLKSRPGQAASRSSVKPNYRRGWAFPAGLAGSVFAYLSTTVAVAEVRAVERPRSFFLGQRLNLAPLRA